MALLKEFYEHLEMAAKADALLIAKNARYDGELPSRARQAAGWGASDVVSCARDGEEMVVANAENRREPRAAVSTNQK